MHKQTWNVNKLLDWAINYFKTKNIPNPRLSAELLLSAVLNLSRMELYLKYNYELNDSQLKKYKAFILRRLENEPIQYITNEAYFRKIKLYVDKNVLIPRPETELLVEKAKRTMMEMTGMDMKVGDKSSKPLNILEVGSGSGAVAISLLYETQPEKGCLPPIKIIATEISKSASEITYKNAAAILDKDKLGCLRIVNCDVIPEKDDEFANDFKDNIDIVISNPPYIKTEDFDNLEKEIKDFEPKEALVAGKTGTESYARIISKVKPYINKSKVFFLFETDPKTYRNLKEIIESEFRNPKVTIDKDYNDLERILIAEVVDADFF
ncbi:MAG: peptide chain release factor N(5)-glutamine methyltransferase [Actinomycetota bacterium]|nr:peptide chain release factor N(5)-glutamine methyltransferase [Actinomycetota bacterium]